MLFGQSLSLALSVGFLGVGTYASPIAGSSAKQPASNLRRRAIIEPGNILTPIREDVLFPLRKRGDDHERLQLRDEVDLLFMGSAATKRAVIEARDGKSSGLPGEGYIAHMKLTKPDAKHPLILLEHFDDLTESVTCKDPKTIALKFANKNLMASAIKEWSWVNKASDKYFFLITHHEHEGCGPELQRAPYKVASVSSDPNSSTATLKVEQATWDETAQNYEMTLGGFGQKEKPMEKRQLDPSIFGDLLGGAAGKAVVEVMDNPKGAKQIGEDVVDWFAESLKTISSIKLLPKHGPGSVGAHFPVGLKHVNDDNLADLVGDKFVSFDTGDNLKNLTLISDPFPAAGSETFIVKCEDCYIKGGLNFAAKAVRKEGKLNSLSVKVNPKDLSMQLDLSVYGFVQFEKTKEIKLVSVPIAPVGIPYILDFGPKLDIIPGMWFSTGISGGFNVGFKAGFPNSATAELDFMNKDNCKLEGFTPTFEGVAKSGSSHKDKHLESVSQVVGYIMPALNFGVQVLGGAADVGAYIGFKPLLAGKMTVGYNEKGFCSPDPKKPAGIKLEAEAKAQIIFHTGIESKVVDTSLIPYFEKTWDITPAHKFGEICRADAES
ncbi:hypothetical protein TWF694_004575 [Orbilia ellipsospora]|uniref:Uncharacterized protein n=1 Tax=Orbilia ellipsospora TaxID=2528407 RepID=A0AAV9WX37_9PEZI